LQYFSLMLSQFDDDEIRAWGTRCKVCGSRLTLNLKP
jgi:hypothetical protein